jgi:conjugative transfer region protein TrbK
MRSIAQLGLAALIAGTMVAVAFVTLGTESQHEPPPLPSELQASHDPLAPELARCASESPPDPSCEAVWAAHRRRFFGEDRPLPEPRSEAITAAHSADGSGSENASAMEGATP